MRHRSTAFSLALCLWLTTLAPTAAIAAQDKATPGPDTPSDAAVREYIDLFGYREMLELGVRQQLAAVVELVRQTSPELQPGVLERLRTELEGDVGPSPSAAWPRWCPCSSAD
jgi:hypothetical protein